MVAPLFGYYLIKPKVAQGTEPEPLYQSRFYVFFRKLLTWCHVHLVCRLDETHSPGIFPTLSQTGTHR